MNNLTTIISHGWKVAISLALGVLAFFFWSRLDAQALNFHEQYQLFLFTSDYLALRLHAVGGLADYLGEFITQFYYHPSLGALLIALLMVGQQGALWWLCRRLGAHGMWYALTLLPVIVLWRYMGNINSMLSLNVSLLAATLVAVALCRPMRVGVRLAVLAVAVPAFFMLFGATLWVWLVVVMAYVARQRRQWWLVVLMAVYAAASVVVVARLTPSVLEQVALGSNFFRFPRVRPSWLYVTLALFALTPVATAWLPALRRGRVFVALGCVAMMLALGFVWVRAGVNYADLVATDYDRLVRQHAWDDIVAKAQRRPATMPMTIASVNLALSQRGELLDNMFLYNQIGTQGLLPHFSIDMMTPLTTAEIYYLMGMVTMAERYTFEAQEAIPNGRQSGRMMKRLAECSIIGGHYAVARKYLRLLTHTAFYRQWAHETLALLAQPALVASHKEYGTLRSRQLHGGDSMFNGDEMEQMLGQLFCDHGRKSNRMAYEYLLAYVALKRDVGQFMAYYSLGQHLHYDRMPTVVQQVVSGSWLLEHASYEGLTLPIERDIADNTAAFMRTHAANPSAPSLFVAPLATNVWHYLTSQAE